MNFFSAIRFALCLTTAFLVQGPALAEVEYPAAYFEPYIVYQAPEIAEKASAENESTAPESESSTPEPEEDPYPAAYYEPVIVYQDKALIAAQEKQRAAASKSAAPANEAKPSPAPAAAPVVTDEGGFPMSVMVLLVAVIGGLGWFMTRNKGEAAVAPAAVEAEPSENPDEAAGDEAEGEVGDAEEQPES